MRFVSSLWRGLFILLLTAVAQAATVTTSDEVTISGPFALEAKTEAWIATQSAKIFLPSASPRSPLVSDVPVSCWRRYDLDAPLAKRGQQLWFTIGTLDRRTEAFLVVDNHVIESAAAGYAVPITQRTVPVQDLALPLTTWHGGSASVYVRYSTALPPLARPKIRETAAVVAAHNSGLAFDFSYFGAFAMLLIVRCGLFLFHRDRATRDYVLLTIGLMIGVVARAGYWDVYLAPQLGTPFLLGDFRFLIRIINSVLAWRTVNSFFDFRRTLPRLDRTMRIATWVALALALVAFAVPSPFKVALSGIVQLMASVLIAGGCVAGIQRRVPGAISFSIGWVWIVFLTSLISAHAFGLGPNLDQEFLTRITILALLWENTVNTIVITRRFRNLQAIENLAAVRGQQASHRKQLLKLLTHDIANPASAIKNSVWLLRRSVNNQDAGRSIENADRIDAGVKEIFDIVSRVRTLDLASGENVKLEPIDVVPVIASTLEGFQPRLEAKQMVVKTRFESKAVFARADRVLLASSLLANALSNAIKFSPRGGSIEVNVSTQQESVLIVIRDFGIGIPAEDRRRLEELAIPIPSRTGTEHEEGTGFGLQIMSTVAREMGGTVAIRSQTADEHQGPSGTTIVISLPAAKPSAPPRRAPLPLTER